MDNICTIPLYSEKNDLGFLDDEIKKSTLDNVVANVASSLKKGASFATSITLAEDQEKYEDNIINKLIPDLIYRIEKGLGTRFSSLTLGKIQKELKDEFIPKEDKVQEGEIPTTNTREETQNKNKQKPTLRQLRNIIFKGSNLLSDYQNKEFSKQIREVIIFNSKNKQRTLVYNQKTLNENLKQYKQNLYELIYDYCKKNGIQVPNKRSYYNSNNIFKGEEVLDAFYEYIMSLSPDERLAILEESWEKSVTLGKKDDNNLLQAVNAYITLANFDELISSVVGKYISINYKLDEPINTIINNNGAVQTKYKYDFGKKQSNMAKDFRDVIQNALDTMGNFSKFLIESIPRINSAENITQIQFINSLLHLKQAIKNLSSTEEHMKYKNLLAEIHSTPSESWKKILNYFANQSSYNSFIKAGLTQEDIDIINSIQRYLYGKSKEEKKSSLYSLEKEVHNIIGYKEVYPLVDTILGTIDSISEMNYLEQYWDYETQMPNVRIKRKYFTNKQKLDLISGINQESSKPLSEIQKETYKISYLNGPFTFQIGQNIFKIQPKFSSEFGIFDKDVEVTVNDKSVSSYFKEINLNGVKNRKLILEATEGINKEFLDLLKYIDKVLTTGFAINNESLQKFYIYNTQSQKGLENLIIAASRVYLVKDIERNFDKDIKSGKINPNTGNPYNIRELYDWMENNPSLVPITQFTKPKNELNKSYFASLLGIPYLKPVQYNETWIDILGNAQAILMGESLKAVTKNFEGENIPNYSPAFLGAEINEINARNQNNPTTAHLLFSGNFSSAIKQVCIDTDIRMSDGTTKQIKNATEAELQYHFFVNKFLLPFSTTDEKPYRGFLSQPSVYADKSKFVEYEVSLNGLKIDSLKDTNVLINRIKETLGNYFKEVQNNIVNDYTKLFTYYQLISNLSTQPSEADLELIRKKVETAPQMSLIEIQNNLKKYTLKEILKIVDSYNKNIDKPIELIQDLHYRVINGQLGLNEILIYKNEYIMQDLPNILKQETINYVNLLLDSGVIFDTNLGFKAALQEMADDIGIKLKDWIDSNGMLILAKQITEEGTIDIIAGEQISGSNIVVNPILERYVLLHNLITNNLKEALIGNEAIHKIKVSPANLNVQQRTFLGFEPLQQVDLVDALLKVNKVEDDFLKSIGPDNSEEDLASFTDTFNYISELREDILNQIRKLENLADIAQLKRTVAVPGTMRYYLQKTLTGILPTLRGAIIQDTFASVFNFEGETKDNLEAHDGQALLNPITAVWQNNSLQDSEVGDIIKPLWQIDIPTYGGKRLVKYAANTITNAMMVNSQFSEISMYHMFKKMTHSSDPNSELRWGKQYQTDGKNLFNQYKHRRNNPKVTFADIIQQSGSLYYSIGDKVYQIIGVGFKNGAYYTEEQEVKILANGSVKTVNNLETYYHYFNENGDHFKLKEGDIIPENLHTVDSIYELHKMFGGINSLSFKDEQFVTSDASIKATAALLNMVSEPTQKCIDALRKNQEIEDTQDYYYQPLKYKMVDYLINQSAIKNGSGNINFNTVYQNPENELNSLIDDEPLRYIELDTQRYGIQQDSEHEADEEELTEMSQVISAIDAGGYYHEEVAELYQAIGQLALQASRVELTKIQQFLELSAKANNANGGDKKTLKLKAQNYLYDLIGRVLIEHLSLNRGQNGIAESLIDEIKRNFGTSTDHSLDDIKIAFSDQVIYNRIISTVASILNKKSVKRKFPGTGQVMAAGFNIVQLWNINDRYAKYEDLVKEAVAAGYTSNSNIPEQYNKDIVKQYLADRQKKYAEKYTKEIPLKIDGTNYDSNFWEAQLQYLNPIDIIQCTVDDKILKPIKLEKIKDYYEFKSNPIQYLLDKKLITEIPKVLKVVKRIDIPSNLAPLRCKFIYEDENGIKHAKNIYDVWAVKDMYFALEEYKKSLPIPTNDYERHLNSKKIELERIRLRKEEQRVLNSLDKNIYIDRDGKEYKVSNLESTEAQTVMSNIYKSKFNLNSGESLYDILKQGPKRFLKSPLKMLPKQDTYDLAMLKSNGEGVLISFNENDLQSVQGFYKVKNKEFQNIHEHEIVQVGTGTYVDSYTKQTIQGKTLDGRTIYSYIYALDSNNLEVVPIAVKLDLSDSIEFDGKNFIYKKDKTIVPSNLELSVKDGKVLQTVQFINKKVISPTHANKYTVYNVKEKQLQQLLGKDFFKNIIQNLYKQDNYTYIMPSKYVNINNLPTIIKSIGIIKSETVDPDIKDYLNKFEGTLDKLNTSGEELVQIPGYNGIFKDYNYKLAEKVYQSFKESLYFISSRIPAQSLQSFMKMKVVGFTNSEANIAYVTHWQTWLQGSDYDIDKSYMLGNEFDDNGLYQGWSKLFDYSNLEASKKLPFPTGISAHMPKENGAGILIESFVQEFKTLDENDIAGKLDLYNRLIRYVNKQSPEPMEDFNGEIAIPIAKFDDENKKIRRFLVDVINAHNKQESGLNNMEAQLKNFISNKLQRIIQGTSNLIGSHAPITLDAMHDAANSSSHQEQVWTTLNPGYIPYMQNQAMVGKKDVGIAANGQKTSFIWKFWMTDSINNNNPYKEFVNFPREFNIKRIEGRFGENFGIEATTKYIKRLPDINMYNASEEDKIFYEFNENHYIPSDQMSSQMISAATDNAKELIMAKINANTDLSKVYMYLITLGFDVKDIVSFMTSPAIDLIAKNSIQNIFTGTNFKTKDVANYILNEIDSKLGIKSSRSTYSLNNRYSFVLGTKVEAFLNKYSENLVKLKEDIEEFIKIYELSEEFSYAGRLLGLNGGVPTTKEKLIKFRKFIKDMVSSREIISGLKSQKNNKFVKNDAVIDAIIPEDLRDLVNNIDPDLYLQSKEYRERVIRYYDIIKGSLNIPAMVEGTRQFQTILDIANIVNVIDKDGIAKSKAANRIYDKIIQRYPYTDSKYVMQLLPILNQVFIGQFIEQNPITIPVQKGWEYLSKKWQIKSFEHNGNFTVGGDNYGLTLNTSISSFHYLMDTHIIPALKNGELFDLKNNAFIQNLIPIIDGSQVRYKINIDMRAAQSNPESKVVLKNIIKGLEELQNYNFGDKNLLDIFMLYSLVVDQNKQGSDRLTDLFSTFVDSTHSENNLLKDYYKFMGNIETYNEDFINEIDQLSINGFLVALANKTASDIGHNEPSIKVMTNEGVIDYKFNMGFGKYQSFGNFLPRVKAFESESDKLLRISHREQYQFGLIYDGYILDILENFVDLDNSQVWIETFADLLTSGYINTDTNCK